jgi:hypothetical protein
VLPPPSPRPLSCQLGPVVGRVTPHSAVVLLEVDARCRVRLSLVEPFTGEGVVVENDCVPYVPAVFHFDLLRPDRRYLLYIEVGSCWGHAGTQIGVCVRRRGVLAGRAWEGV